MTDENGMTPEIYQKLEELCVSAARLSGKVEAHHKNVIRIMEIAKGSHELKISKMIMGALRDLSCELIALGSNLRRQCDLFEPVIDQDISKQDREEGST